MHVMTLFITRIGGLIAVLIIYRKAVEENIKKIAEKYLATAVDWADWQQQLSMLQTFKQYQDENRKNITTNFVIDESAVLIQEEQNPEIGVINKGQNDEKLQAEPKEVTLRVITVEKRFDKLQQVNPQSPELKETGQQLIQIQDNAESNTNEQGDTQQQSSEANQQGGGKDETTHDAKTESPETQAQQIGTEGVSPKAIHPINPSKDYIVFYRGSQAVINPEKFFHQIITFPQ